MSRQIQHKAGTIEASLKEAHDKIGDMAINETNITNEWLRATKENKSLRAEVIRLTAELMRMRGE